MRQHERMGRQQGGGSVRAVEPADGISYTPVMLDRAQNRAEGTCLLG